MRLTAGLVLMMLSGLGVSQTADQDKAPGFQKPKERAVGTGLGKVTNGDAVTVLKKVEESFKFVLGVKISKPMAIKPSATPVDRKAVVAEFIRLRAAASPAFRMKMRAAKFDAKRLTWSSAELSDLIKGGYVAPLGPIATNKASTLTPREFGDALGYFLARISEVTYQPSTKWTPFLQGPDA